MSKCVSYLVLSAKQQGAHGDHGGARPKEKKGKLPVFQCAEEGINEGTILMSSKEAHVSVKLEVKNMLLPSHFHLPLLYSVLCFLEMIG